MCIQKQYYALLCFAGQLSRKLGNGTWTTDLQSTLSEPKSVAEDSYIKDLKNSQLGNPEEKSKLIESFKKQQRL